MRYNTYMKKTIVVLILTAMTATSAFARDITVSFTDGSQHQYKNTPDNVSPEQVQARVAKDFPGKQLANLDGGAPSASAEDKGWCSPGWALAGCVALGLVVLVAVSPLLVATGGGCQHYNDRASDGSLCGKRSADYRPGGK